LISSSKKYVVKMSLKARHQWVTSLILATWEAEMERIEVGGQPRQKVLETPSQPMARHSGIHLSSQVTDETEIGRIMVPGQTKQKVCKTPSQWEKTGHGGAHLTSP
jgi:hypothetical protein